MQTKIHQFNEGFVNNQWRSCFKFGMSALDDWSLKLLDASSIIQQSFTNNLFNHN
ncbi:hypothetical protein [Pedobacter borealis]|uniref:hypothetical protein n=1 Tax=Pedobacter borealis TaxID=475254 RepID=UPI000A5D3BD6|nr:hypothetical protein [Pedobacter borealis]